MALTRSSLLSLSTGLALLSTSAYAEEICAGLGANTLWIGGAQASSNISTSADYLEQMALVLGTNQYVAGFEVSEGADIRVEAAGRGNGDTIIDLFSADGTLIATDDDSGGMAASRTENFLEPGTYCVALRSFDDAPMTAFVRVGRMDQEPLTQGIEEGMGDSGDSGDAMDGDVCAAGGTAPILEFDSPQSASVDDVSEYRFTLDAPMPISLTATNEDADPLITLYSADGTYIAENDDSDGLNSRINLAQPQDPGEYCLSVQALSDTTLPVEVTLVAYDPVAAMQALYDSGEASPPLDGSYPVTDLGEVKSRLRTDVQLGTNATWLKFDVPQSGVIVVEAISASSDGDPTLRLFDDLGRELAYNDDYGDGFDSFVAVRVQPGSYLAAVSEVSDGAMPLVRLLVETYVPAR